MTAIDRLKKRRAALAKALRQLTPIKIPKRFKALRRRLVKMRIGLRTRIKALTARIKRLQQQQPAAGPTVMFDDVTVNLIPANAPSVACYVNGRFANCTAMRARFPHVPILTIAISDSADADCLDIETTDATPAQAPAWVKRQHARGVKRPVVYASTSVMPQVINALAAAGIARSTYRVWTAHYTFTPHLCKKGEFGLQTDADATQWTDKALGRSLDQSLLKPDFF